MAPRHSELPDGPVKVCQMDFIQLPPPHGYKSVFIMVCMFAHWTEGFPWRQNTASMAKILLEKHSLFLGNLLSSFSVRKNPFPNSGASTNLCRPASFVTLSLGSHRLNLQGQLKALTALLRLNWQNVQITLAESIAFGPSQSQSHPLCNS